jgi:hypothetical protein
LLQCSIGAIICHNININAICFVIPSSKLSCIASRLRLSALLLFAAHIACETGFNLAEHHYSPVCISEPWRRALCKSLANAKAPAANSTTLSAKASSIKSGRKTLSITSARMPSNT